MPFEPIRKILPSAIASAGIGVQVTAARVVEVAAETIRREWGEERASYVTVVSFSGGSLKVHTRSSAAAQTLKVETTKMMNAVNRALGSLVVKSLLVYNA